VAPVRPRPRRADDEDVRPGGNNALLIGLLAGGGVLALLFLMVCGGVLAWVLYYGPAPNRPGPVAKAVAPDPAPAPPANNFVPPNVPDNNPPQAAPPADPPGGLPPLPGMPQPPGASGNPRGNAPGNNQYPVVLSNARVFRRGARLEASVDYRWVRGGPALGQHVFVIIRSGRNTYEANIFPTHVRQEGTFNLTGITFGIGGIDRGPYEFYLETGLPGPFGPRERLSNTVTAR
jgi:hypothetical protein